MLSGYLITDLLVAEYGRHRGIGLKHFWIRRARRLLPALFVMLFVTVGWATLFDRSQLAALRSDLPAGIFYVSNWWFIFHHVSYFARFGPPSPLGHLWSLAIEEQFYLVWPLLVLAGFRWIHSKRTLILLTLARGRRLGHRDGRPLSLARRRSHPGLRRHRHPGLRPADRGRPGHGAAPQPDLRPGHPQRPAAAQRGRRRVAARDLRSCSGTPTSTSPSSTEGGMVLLALLTALVIGVTVHPGSQLRTRPRVGAAPLGGGAVVRHLPLALPGHRADHAARRPAQRGAGRPPDRRHLGHRRPVVALRRATGPARRPRPAVGADPPARLVPGPSCARSDGCWSGRVLVNAVLCALGLFGVVVGLRRRPGLPGHQHRAPRPPPPADFDHDADAATRVAPRPLPPPAASAGRPGGDRHRGLDHGRCRPVPPTAAPRHRHRRPGRPAALPGAGGGAPAQGRGSGGEPPDPRARDQRPLHGGPAGVPAQLPRPHAEDRPGQHPGAPAVAAAGQRHHRRGGPVLSERHGASTGTTTAPPTRSTSIPTASTSTRPGPSTTPRSWSRRSRPRRAHRPPPELDPATLAEHAATRRTPSGHTADDAATGQTSGQG